jgi:hypothetical protein
MAKRTSYPIEKTATKYVIFINNLIISVKFIERSVMSATLKALLVVAVGTFLASCGGGGAGGGGLSLGNLSSETTITIGGSASKGILQGATAQAYDASSSISSPKIITGASGTTGTDGSYRISGIPSNQAPIVVSVTTTAKTSTTPLTVMLDETQPLNINGQFPIAVNQPPVGFVLRTIIPSSLVSQIAHVTPLSEFATQLAQNATSTTTANSKFTTTNSINLSRAFLINTFGGVDPFFNKPVIGNLLNGSPVTMTNDQQKSMLMLIALQKRANQWGIAGCTINNVAVTEKSGLKCLVNELASYAVMTIDASGNATFPQAGAFANYLGQLVNNALGDTSLQRSAFFNKISNQRLSFQVTPQINLTAVNTATSLDAFVNGIRLGLFNTQSLLNSSADSIVTNVNGIVVDKVANVESLVDKIFAQCRSNTGSNGGYKCVSIPGVLSFTSIGKPPTITGISNSTSDLGTASYNFVYVVNPAAQTYRTLEGSIQGGVFPAQGNGNMTLTITEYACTALSPAIAATGTSPGVPAMCSNGTQSSKLASISIYGQASRPTENIDSIDTPSNITMVTPVFLITQYSSTNSKNYETLNLSGLNIQSDNTNVTASGQLVYSNTSGDSISGFLTNFVGVRYVSPYYRYNTTVIPTNVNLALNVSATSTRNLIGANITYTNSIPANYNPFVDNIMFNTTATSSVLSMTPVLTASLVFPNNVIMNLTASQANVNSKVVDLRLTSGGSWVDFQANFVPVASCATCPSIVSLNNANYVMSSDGISVTSSATSPAYSAKIYGADNQLIGSIFSGTTRIGSIDNSGMISVNGLLISLQ